MVLIKVEGPVLLLIGPIGIFFSRLASFFRENGVEVHKIDFPIREVFFSRGAKRHRYKGKPEAFNDYLARLIDKYHFRQIYMSGDFYNVHQSAIQLAKQHDIDAYVFELGYVRPNYVTLEKNQVNARSNLNQPAKFYQQLPTVKQLPKPEIRRQKFAWRELFVPICFVIQCFCRYRLIPHEHRSQPKFGNLYYESLGALLKHWYRFSEKKAYKKISNLRNYFVVPLQVNTDSQISISSDYAHIRDFIAEVLVSFANHAKSSDSLILKHHPAERAYNNYNRFIHQQSIALNIVDRVIYVHDFPLDQLYEHCKGVITINSTVGIDSLKHFIPTKTMGRTFYDIGGLTHQGKLDNFWQKPTPVNKALLKKFYRHMVDTTQVNGNFHGEFPFDTIFQIGQQRTAFPRQLSSGA